VGRGRNVDMGSKRVTKQGGRATVVLENSF
jgi:hypothetical protein